MAPFRIVPPSGPGPGHWEGNVNSTRYGVYPSGSYSIGDEWRQVIYREDRGYYSCTGAVSGDTTCAGIWPPCPSDSCCDGWACSPWPVGFCFPCTRNVIKKVWNPDWWTLYRRYRYEFMQWVVLGDVWVRGNFSS